MKFCFTFLLVLFALAGYGQQPAAFIGTWKVSVIKTGEADFYLENDSTVFHESIKQKIKDQASDTISVRIYLELMKLMGRTLSYSFHADGHYEQSFSLAGEETTISGTYVVDETKREIHYTSKNPDGSISQTKDSFRWNGKFLQLTMSGEGEEPAFYELKKVKG